MNKYIILFALFVAGQSKAFDTLTIKQIYPSITYIKLADTTKPVVINLMIIDLLDSSISIDGRIAHDGLNLGGEKISKLISRQIQGGEQILAGVNADFFGDYPMQAQNSIIIDGEIVKAVNLKRTLIAFTQNNIPSIGRFHFRIKSQSNFSTKGINSNDTTLSSRIFTHHFKGFIKKRIGKKYSKFFYDGQINPNITEVLLHDSKFDMSDSIEVDTNFLLFEHENKKKFEDTIEVDFEFVGLSADLKTMTGGLPSLYYNEMIPDSFFGRDGMKSKKFLGLNPRTAIGYNKNKTKLFVAAVDGRQPAYSMGFSIKELARFMYELGCYDALNLDGGGSTTMCIGDSVVNSPSDFFGERPVYNSLIIRAK